ncbi:DUF7620 family protein [Nocardioides jensenii]|uniref:DUF7620 family protein n=1 Tax=Nocardioides jensenii TaxID=1843 RepID=UPI0012FA2D8D|nr:hypothetical protein [Nocardioides jensenii]
MKWVWKRRLGRPSEATEAREQAERDLEQAQAETPAIEALAARLRELREHNHFASAIATSFQGRKP